VDQRRRVILWCGLPAHQQRRLETVGQDVKTVGDFRMYLEQHCATPISHRHDRVRLWHCAPLETANQRAATVEERVSGPEIPELDDERSVYNG
jgi:hypothetical protein